MSVGDLDGDGDYEYIVKWDPSNAKDNSQDGITGTVYLDAYQTDGTRFWRIDLSINIRAARMHAVHGYDLDGDGNAEVAMKTAPGTKDGTGAHVILPGHDAGSRLPRFPHLRHRRRLGLRPERSGVPHRLQRPDRRRWRPRRSSSPAAASATGRQLRQPRRPLPGRHRLPRRAATQPDHARGYYERTTLTAWDCRRGGQLTNRWIFDTENQNPDPDASYEGQAHSLSIADADGDGKDEIVYGRDDRRQRHRPEAQRPRSRRRAHASDMDPSRPGIEVFQVHEGTGSTDTSAAVCETPRPGRSSLRCRSPEHRPLVARRRPRRRRYRANAGV